MKTRHRPLPDAYMDPDRNRPGGGSGAPSDFEGIPHGYSMLAFGRDGNVYRRGLGLTVWRAAPNHSKWPREFNVD